MVEWFQSIGKFIAQYSDKISLIFSSTTFATIVAVVVAIIKSIKSNKELTNQLTANNKISTAVAKLDAVTQEATEKLDEVNKHTSEFEKKIAAEIELLTLKVNAILDVQNVVYSTIHDDMNRENVLNIINNAKYAELSQKLDLQKQIEDLKASIKKQVDAVTQTVETETSKVAEQLSDVVPKRY